MEKEKKSVTSSSLNPKDTNQRLDAESKKRDDSSSGKSYSNSSHHQHRHRSRRRSSSHSRHKSRHHSKRRSRHHSKHRSKHSSRHRSRHYDRSSSRNSEENFPKKTQESIPQYSIEVLDPSLTNEQIELPLTTQIELATAEPGMTLQQKYERELCIGNFPPGLSNNQLSDLLTRSLKRLDAVTESGNPVTNVWMSSDRRYAFVLFRSAEEASMALALKDEVLLGYQIKVSKIKIIQQYSQSGMPLGPLSNLFNNLNSEEYTKDCGRSYRKDCWI